MFCWFVLLICFSRRQWYFSHVYVMAHIMVDVQVVEFMVDSLHCPKSPSARGFIESFPVHLLLFKYV